MINLFDFVNTNACKNGIFFSVSDTGESERSEFSHKEIESMIYWLLVLHSLVQLSRGGIEEAQALGLHSKTSFMSFNLSNVGEFSGVEFSRTVSELKQKGERERERRK